MTNNSGRLAPAENGEYKSGFVNVLIDEELRARAQRYIDENNISVADLARQLGRWDRSTISRYLAGKYGQVEGVEASLRSFFLRLDRMAEGDLFVNTRIAALVMEHCEYALQNRGLVVITGPAGNGKSTAAGEFMRRQLRAGNTAMVYVICNSLTTSTSLLLDICAELGLKHRTTRPEMLRLIIAELKRRPHLLIIDDAGFLKLEGLEALRAMYEQAGCGLVLMGVGTLSRTLDIQITARQYEDLEQFLTRVDLMEKIPDVLSKKEAAEIVRRRCPWIAESDIDAIAHDAKNPRSLVKLCGQVDHIRSNYQRAGKPVPEVVRLAEVAESRIFRTA